MEHFVLIRDQRILILQFLESLSLQAAEGKEVPLNGRASGKKMVSKMYGHSAHRSCICGVCGDHC